ncbi:competence protein ComEC [Caldanaerobius fijiensis DSM 17918]|uniref:Competence protein ComEC n=1 Tax=Caldanaerobius fijiensis DSM 17918 TaxID=1121256 RepID=A0A1M4SGT1_9THEO|nr:DNA internalization-related competence protein ComEC/Rec2 [Caldanaerobius fijiensis]SHE31474.1 competence protein ComEC [Caldanaerobius fijiensis DSM 17918]
MKSKVLFDRPLVIPSLLLCAGIVIGRYLSHPVIFLWSVFALFFFYALYRYYYILLALFLAFGAYVSSRALSVPSDYLSLAGTNVNIRGYIVTQPLYRPQKVSFDLKPYNVNTEQKIRINMYSNSNFLPDLKYGDILDVKVKVKLPRGRTNPFGFDYSLYLKKNGVYAIGSTDINGYKRIGKRDMGFLGLAMGIKDKLNGTIHACMDNPYSDLLSSMLLGYDFRDEDVIESFSTSGVMHILAISGFNVGIIFSAVFFMAKPIKDVYIKNTIAIVVLLIYLFLVGFSPSMLRAALMAIIFLIGQFFKRQADSLNSLSAAAILLLIINPLSLFDVSFQLSFVATASLILFYPTVYKYLRSLPISENISSLMAMTISAQLGVLPFLVYYFHKISIISILANVVVVPFAAFLIPLGFLLILTSFIPAVSAFLTMPLVGIIYYVLRVTDFLSNLPYAAITVPFPGFIWIGLYYLFLFRFTDIIEFDARYTIASMILALALFIQQFYIPGPLTISFIDVGQGDSILIVTPHKHSLLIDGGRLDTRTGFDAGKAIVEPYLLMNGIGKLDAVIATHPDADHMGGLLTVVRDMPVKSAIVYQKCDDSLSSAFYDALRDKRVPIKYLHRGYKIHIDGVTLEVLNPPQPTPFENDNDNSLVFRLLYKKASILLTGDMGLDAEKDLVADSIDLKADVLKVSHHGSATAGSQEFVQAVGPLVSIISVGENNYGHPSKIVLERLKNTRIFRTDMNGAIVLKTDGERYYIRPFLRR